MQIKSRFLTPFGRLTSPHNLSKSTTRRNRGLRHGGWRGHNAGRFVGRILLLWRPVVRWSLCRRGGRGRPLSSERVVHPGRKMGGRMRDKWWGPVRIERGKCGPLGLGGSRGRPVGLRG